MFLDLVYYHVEGPSGVMYACNIERQSQTLELGEGETSSGRAMEAAQLLRQRIVDAGGPLLELREEYPPQEADVSQHLRLYSHPALPADVAARDRTIPPLSYDFGLLGLQKTTVLRPGDRGDIPEMRYSYQGEPVCRRLFAFVYATDPDGATELTVYETPGWAREDGTWCDGPVKEQTYDGERYNKWRDDARARIFGGLKTWLPRVLFALGQVADIPAGEALSGSWLATNHAAPWQHYLSSGRKEAITASLLADATPWLSLPVPDGLLEGVEPGTSVRHLILDALR